MNRRSTDHSSGHDQSRLQTVRTSIPLSVIGSQVYFEQASIEPFRHPSGAFPGSMSFNEAAPSSMAETHFGALKMPNRAFFPTEPAASRNQESVVLSYT